MNTVVYETCTSAPRAKHILFVLIVVIWTSDDSFFWNVSLLRFWLVREEGKTKVKKGLIWFNLFSLMLFIWLHFDCKFFSFNSHLYLLSASCLLDTNTRPLPVPNSSLHCFRFMSVCLLLISTFSRFFFILSCFVGFCNQFIISPTSHSLCLSSSYVRPCSLNVCLRGFLSRVRMSRQTLHVFHLVRFRHHLASLMSFVFGFFSLKTLCIR